MAPIAKRQWVNAHCYPKWLHDYVVDLLQYCIADVTFATSLLALMRVVGN